MENSITLPIAALAHEGARARAFRHCGRWRFRETAYFSFNTETIDEITELQCPETEEERNGVWWSEVLFFPEGWPPDRIRDYVHFESVQMSLLF